MRMAQIKAWHETASWSQHATRHAAVLPAPPPCRHCCICCIAVTSAAHLSSPCRWHAAFAIGEEASVLSADIVCIFANRAVRASGNKRSQQIKVLTAGSWQYSSAVEAQGNQASISLYHTGWGSTMSEALDLRMYDLCGGQTSYFWDAKAAPERKKLRHICCSYDLPTGIPELLGRRSSDPAQDCTTCTTPR